jgi:hypothetical protein
MKKNLTPWACPHAALYLGGDLSTNNLPTDHGLAEADTVQGGGRIGLEKFADLHTRICRPVLSHEEVTAVTKAALCKIAYP